MKQLITLISALFFLTIGVSQVWALPNCVGQRSIAWQNCFGTYTWASGTKYVGDFKDDKRTGQGTITWANGEKYVGDFKDDKRTGQGTYTWTNGNKYVGDFNDGKKTGQGTFTWPSGSKYVGDFNDGKRTGQGTYTWPSGSKWVGEWENDNLNGYAIIYNANGSINKEGIFKDDKFLYAQKGRKVDKPNVLILKTTFMSLSKQQRMQLQKNLKSLGFYTSSIDGLFGAGTLVALMEYNKQNLNGAALTKTKNVGNLITAVLKLKPLPKIDTDQNSNETFKVASGTGFYVSEKGHIITNHHVIDGCTNMKVHSKGKVLETIKIADDKRNDLALLKISQRPTHVFALTDDSPFSLQEIIVAGFPFGERVSSTLKFTQGIVSSIVGLGNDYSQIQIDAALQPGNSGGPILDEYGNIVAVAVAKLSLKKILKDYGVIPENTNFGVKVSAVRNLMEGNNVSFKTPNSVKITRQELSKNATDGTVYLTCWMTTAQIEQMKTTKVLFEDLN